MPSVDSFRTHRPSVEPLCAQLPASRRQVGEAIHLWSSGNRTWQPYPNGKPLDIKKSINDGCMLWHQYGRQPWWIWHKPLVHDGFCSLVMTSKCIFVRNGCGLDHLGPPRDVRVRHRCDLFGNVQALISGTFEMLIDTNHDCGYRGNLSKPQHVHGNGGRWHLTWNTAHHPCPCAHVYAEFAYRDKNSKWSHQELPEPRPERAHQKRTQEVIKGSPKPMTLMRFFSASKD